MREIKFRAWDKTRAVMEHCIDVNPFYIGDCDRRRWNRDEVELMQYTGLKDKNGKEIWEGDILREVEYGIGNVYKVVWRKDGWHLDGTYGQEYDNGDYYHGYDVHWTDFEVIGNIYEHPNLFVEERE